MKTQSPIIAAGIVYLLVAISNAQIPDLKRDFEEEAQRHPALRLAQEGKFTEAWGYVERGQDTKGFYQRGVQYFNYWAVRTTRRTPSGMPDPDSAVILNDINEDTIRANEKLMHEYQAEAEKGNPEAKAWMQQYAPWIKLGRVTQDVVSEGVKRADQQQNAAPAPVESESRYTIVGVPFNDHLKIRSGPGMGYPPVCTVDNGQTGIIVTGDVSMNGDTDWYPVKIGEYNGWTRGKYLKKD